MYAERLRKRRKLDDNASSKVIKRRAVKKSDSRNAEILLTSEEKTRNQVLPMILPYLPFVDLVALSAAQLHPSISSLVDNHLTSRKQTIIDVNFIQRFPVESNRDTYKRLAIPPEIPLIISGIAESDATALLEHQFNQVQSLTLEKMEMWLSSGYSLPRKMKSLKISDSTIDMQFLYSWLDDCSAYLETLHMCRVSWVSESEDAVFCRVIHYLKNLIVEEMDGTFDYFLSEVEDSTRFTLDLESLTIIAPKGCRWPHIPNTLQRLTIGRGVESRPAHPDYVDYERELAETNFLALKYLSMGCLHPDKLWKNFKFGESFKTFECQSAPIDIDEIFNWTHLEDVKIHCNWYHADQLRTHFKSIKCCVVTCCAPTPGYNLIYSLNEDCLRKIASYLSEDDASNLSAAHPRFVSLRSMVHLDADFLKEYPPKRFAELYEMLGDNVKQLKLTAIFNRSFFDIIGHFKELQRLTMIHPKVMDELKVTAVPLITELRLDLGVKCGLKHKFWGALFHHLNPGLKRLRLDGNVNSSQHMLQLTNIEELRIASSNVDCIFDCPYFFAQNTKLTHLDIHVKNNTPLLVHVLEAIAGDNLKSLVIRNDDSYKYQGRLGKVISRFQNLESLRLPNWSICSDAIKELALLPNLTTLTVSGRELDYFIAQIPRMLKNLKTLNVKHFINFPMWLFEKELDPILEDGKFYYFHIHGKGYTVDLSERKDEAKDTLNSS